MSATYKRLEPSQFLGLTFDDKNNDAYSDYCYILGSLNVDIIKDPHKWQQWVKDLRNSDYRLLQRMMIIDGNGNINIDKINKETLFEANNVGIFDSFSFWAWRKVIVWKLSEEKTSLRVLKHIAAEGAFLGITVTGVVETVGRSLASKIIK
ncbi:hypothetical protein LCGC14_1488090, partial [marine sediment metagenome]